MLAALLVGRGLAWPLARGLASWVRAVGEARSGETLALLRTVGVSATVLIDWIEASEERALVLRDACSASLDLVEALDERDARLIERRRARAWAALQELAADLRAARPSPWARRRGLGW